MKISNLLKFLLRSFVFYADDPDGGGAAAPDRGDTLPDDGAAKDTPDAQAQADAQAEIDRVKAEKDAKAAEGGEKKDDAEKDEKDEKDDADKGKDKKDTRVPLSRHTEILNKERERREAAEARIAQLEKGHKTATVNADIAEIETKIEKLEGDYTKAITDGETTKAAGLMKEIRGLERSASEQKSTMEIAAAEVRAVERVRYDVVVERIETSYPVLNIDHADFDGDKAQDVLDLKTTYEGRGMPPSAALQKAVKTLLGAETAKQETATEVDPKVSDEDKAAAVKAERKEAANKTGIDAAKKTPATDAKAGLDSDKLGGGPSAVNLVNLSQTEFAKLGQDVLSKARGDTL